jgi:hypothetical protein
MIGAEEQHVCTWLFKQRGNIKRQQAFQERLRLMQGGTAVHSCSWYLLAQCGFLRPCALLCRRSLYSRNSFWGASSHRFSYPNHKSYGATFTHANALALVRDGNAAEQPT